MTTNYRLKVRRAVPAVISSQIREKLTGIRHYYCRTDGSNSNNGLSNTPTGAFRTLQYAMDLIYETLDLSGEQVWVHLGNNGTYAGFIIYGRPVGGSNADCLNIQGDQVTPSNTQVNTPIQVSHGANLIVYGSRYLTGSGGISCISAEYGGIAILRNGIEFGAMVDGHINASNGGRVWIQNDYTVVGGGPAHINAIDAGSEIHYSAITATMSGSPAFTFEFANADRGAVIRAASATFSGAATGRRYFVQNNATIWVTTEGSGVAVNHSYFPGNANGVALSGGAYA